MVPDLRVDDVSLPESVTSGHQFVAQVRIINDGDADAPATKVRVYLSQDGEIEQARDTEVATDSVQLARAGHEGAATTLTFAALVAPETVGTYYFGVCVDPVTDESDTVNNCSDVHAVAVTAAPTTPDTIDPTPDTVMVRTPIRRPGGGVQLDVELTRSLTSGDGCTAFRSVYRIGRIHLETAGGTSLYTADLYVRRSGTRLSVHSNSSVVISPGTSYRVWMERGTSGCGAQVTYSHTKIAPLAWNP